MKIMAILLREANVIACPLIHASSFWIYLNSAIQPRNQLSALIANIGLFILSVTIKEGKTIVLLKSFFVFVAMFRVCRCRR